MVKSIPSMRATCSLQHLLDSLGFLLTPPQDDKGMRLRWLPVSLFPAKPAPRTCSAMPCQASSAPTRLFPSALTQANHPPLFLTSTLEWFDPILNQAMSGANSFLTLFSFPNSPLTVTSKVTVACVLRSGSGPSVTSSFL